LLFQRIFRVMAVEGVEEALPYVERALGELVREAVGGVVYPDYRKILHFMYRKNSEARRRGEEPYPELSGVLVGKCLKVLEERGVIQKEKSGRANGGDLYRFEKESVDRKRYTSEIADRVLRMLPVSLLDEPPYVLRERTWSTVDLEASIKEHGLLEPVVVRPAGERYVIVAGCRRVRACRNLGLTEIPCLVRFDLDDKAEYLLALSENLDRENLHPLEEAKAFQRYLDRWGDVRELSQRIHRPISYIVDRLSLLSLPQDVQEKLWENRGFLQKAILIAKELRTSLGGLTKAKASEVMKTVVERRLTVEQTRRLLVETRSAGYDVTGASIQEVTLDRWLEVARDNEYSCGCGARYKVEGVLYRRRAGSPRRSLTSADAEKWDSNPEDNVPQRG